MDFTIRLEENRFISSMEELRQTIYIFLRTQKGEFLQNHSLGSSLSVHLPENSVFYRTELAQTLEQIKGLSVKEVEIIGNMMEVTVIYYKDIVSFSFDITTIYEE